MAISPVHTDRWKALNFGPPPSDAQEPDQPVLVEYTLGERVAVITLNRPHADNAITTAMGARLTEILEMIAVRPTVRAVILTGAGHRAFSVGSDLIALSLVAQHVTRLVMGLVMGLVTGLLALCCPP